MSNIGHNLPAADVLKSIVDRIELLNEEIKALNADKSEVFKEAKGTGFDVKVIREVIKRRAADPFERDEHDTLVSVYEQALQETGTLLATRARTEPHDPETGEITSAAQDKGEREAPASQDEVPSQTDDELANPDTFSQSSQLAPNGISNDGPLTLTEGSEVRDRPLTPNDILGDEPIPVFLQRAAE